MHMQMKEDALCGCHLTMDETNFLYLYMQISEYERYPKAACSFEFLSVLGIFKITLRTSSPESTKKGDNQQFKTNVS